MQNHAYALKMQQLMIREIETAKPKFLIFVSIQSSWLRQPDSILYLFDWFAEYQERFYRRVGVVDLISARETRFLWDEESEGYTPMSTYWVGIYERIKD